MSADFVETKSSEGQDTPLHPIYDNDVINRTDKSEFGKAALDSAASHRAQTRQNPLADAQSILGAENLTSAERNALQAYQTSLQNLQSLKQQRTQLDTQLQQTNSDPATRQKLQAQLRSLDADIAAAEKGISSAEHSHTLSQLSEKAKNAAQQAEEPDLSKKDADNQTNVLEKTPIDSIIKTEIAAEDSYEKRYANREIVTDGSHIENGNPKANTVYRTGEHSYLYETNETGLVIRACTDNLQKKTHDGRMPHNRNTYDKQSSDEAGHLFADRFGGSGQLDNLVSQAKDINRRAFGSLEAKWAAALEKDKTVAVDIEVHYDSDGKRPTSFSVKYQIDGKAELWTITNQNIYH